MKKTLFLFIFLLCSTQTQAGALADKLLELFKDPNEQVSLGAMLISPRVSDAGKLIAYVRSVQKPADKPYVRAVKQYFLAMAIYEEEERIAFINSYPEDPEAYAKTIDFDMGLTNSLGGLMIQELLTETSCDTLRSVRKVAREKILRLCKTHDASGVALELMPEPCVFEACDND